MRQHEILGVTHQVALNLVFRFISFSVVHMHKCPFNLFQCFQLQQQSSSTCFECKSACIAFTQMTAVSACVQHKDRSTLLSAGPQMCFCIWIEHWSSPEAVANLLCGEHQHEDGAYMKYKVCTAKVRLLHTLCWRIIAMSCDSRTVILGGKTTSISTINRWPK